MGNENEEESSPAAPQNEGYSWIVGSVYVFNLMLGAGVLALPKAFVEVGWALGLISVGVLAIFSYCTVTFILETQSVHNAFLLYNNLQNAKGNKIVSGKSEEMEMEKNVVENGHADNGKTPTTENGVKTQKNEKNDTDITDDALYEITTKTELGELAKMFFNKAGYILYYVSICLYLYGGLSIYSASIAKSLASVVCDDPESFKGNSSDPCKRVPSITVNHMYQIMLASFLLICGPFIFFTLSKTKLLQLFTMGFRWFAMTAMIVLAIMKISEGKGNKKPILFEIKKLPNFFGVGLYAFMCQYSIPAVVTPVTNKKRLKISLVMDFICVAAFFSCLLLTAVFAFPAGEVQDLYTLNFDHPTFFRYLLELFPVLTLSANFPILGIVLRDNLKKLFLTKGDAEYNFFLRRILFPLVVLTPPTIIAFSTYNVGMLVGYTGAYAGAIIQYVVPALLVHFARKKAMNVFGSYNNKYQSPFRHTFWIIVVLIWYVVCFIFVTYYKVTSAGH